MQKVTKQKEQDGTDPCGAILKLCDTMLQKQMTSGRIEYVNKFMWSVSDTSLSFSAPVTLVFKHEVLLQISLTDKQMGPARRQRHFAPHDFCSKRTKSALKFRPASSLQVGDSHQFPASPTWMHPIRCLVKFEPDDTFVPKVLSSNGSGWRKSGICVRLPTTNFKKHSCR